jgi:UDP-3-O-[3-hydroxymyristoyl] glucosamine N-acyltransferase
MRRKEEITLTLAQLAERLGGKTVCPGDTDPNTIELTGLSTLELAHAEDLTFISNEKFVKQSAECTAGAFLVTSDCCIVDRPCVVVEHVWKAMMLLFDIWHPDQRPAPGVHASAVVDPAAVIDPTATVGPLAVIEAGAKIGAGVIVGAQCFIGCDVVIGDGTLLHPSVRILERVRVGQWAIIHSGTVLGSDGFGYEVIDQQPVKIPQVGTVVIEDGVEIGANTTIDRAFLHETRIGAGTKIDNLVQIAHNVTLGRCCGLASQVGVAGSTVVGDGVIMWGQVGVPDHVRIGDGAVLLAKSGIKSNIAAGEQVFGTPAIPTRQAGLQHAALSHLPSALKRLRVIEKKLAGLEALASGKA